MSGTPLCIDLKAINLAFKDSAEAFALVLS
jgi:hypothetical protein